VIRPESISILRSSDAHAGFGYITDIQLRMWKSGIFWARATRPEVVESESTVTYKKEEDV